MDHLILSKVDIALDGLHFPAGQPLGRITTEIPDVRLKALFDANVLMISDSAEVVLASIDDTAVDENDENDDDAPIDPIPPINSIAAQTPEDLAAIEFPGLKTRIAVALMSQDIRTAESLMAYVDAKRDLEELNDIGPAAKKEILDWIAAQS